MTGQILFGRFVVFILFALSVGQTALADELSASRERLLRIQERIESTDKSLQQNKTKVRSLRDELRAVDKELFSLARKEKNLKKKLADNQRQQDESRKQISLLRKQIEAQRQTLEKRIGSLYKGGGGGVIKLLFSGMGPAELDGQFRNMLRIVHHDQKILNDYRQQQETLNRKLESLEELKQRQQMDLAELKKSRKVLARASKLKVQILSKVRKDQRLLTSLKKELESKASRLSGLLKQLETAGDQDKNDSPLARQRGKLPWPVEGKVRISFGPQRHPDLGTLFDSNGIEINTEEQTPIKALWKGRVAFASAFKGYGNLVIIDHGSGYHSLYAHASRMVKRVDDHVKQGEVLAFSGYPGTSGVYFEIRRQGKPVDPETWLSRR
ncbi:MAG: hypothetical protein C0624_12805 [Desulfuromonas sp.]|nr:MAG: hypothetical protein C0624_12805 [Desulfuromonas sp.]